MSPEDVVNQALLAVVARAKVASISPSDGSQAGDVAATLYQPKIDALGRSAHWNCLRRQTVLTVLKAYPGTPENPNGTTLPTPPTPWLYEYGLPADNLKIRYLLPTPSTPGTGVVPIMTNMGPGVSYGRPRVAIPFAVAIDTDQNDQLVNVLLTDLSQAIAVYTARIANPDLWDPLFLNAAVATLASFFVNPLNRSAQLAGEQAAMAREAILQARLANGNEGPTATDHTPDWMRVRGIGELGPGEPSWCAPWDAMVFPGGMTV